MIIMMTGTYGTRFVAFLKLKLRQRKGEIDGYKDADLARELHVEYGTLKRWIRQGALDRIDLENYYAVEDLFGQEFKDYMRAKG